MPQRDRDDDDDEEKKEGTYLGDPHGLPASSFVRVLDVFLEVIDVGRTVVPVDVDKIDGAAGASGQEGRQPVDAHERAGASTVGDGGRAELGLACEGVHVLLVTGSGGRGGEIGLCAEVGLIEAGMEGGGLAREHASGG